MSNPAILIVEDNDSVRQMLGMALHDFGFSVYLASNGQEAMQVYQREAIHLVLMDVQMPYQDGPATLAALKTINPNVICCFLSGYTGRYTDKDLLRLGAAAVIEKPFPLEDLRQLLLRLAKQGPPQVYVSEPSNPENNRRAFLRRPTKRDVTVVCTEESLNIGQNLAAAVLDISEAGIRLLLKARLEVGRQVSVRLDGPSFPRPVERVGKIVWSAQAAAEIYGVGVQLEEPMDCADVHQLT